MCLLSVREFHIIVMGVPPYYPNDHLLRTQPTLRTFHIVYIELLKNGLKRKIKIINVATKAERRQCPHSGVL